MGIQIPLYSRIGEGLSIKHYSGIVINGYASIGKCCTLYQGVTIGRSFHGTNKGVPKIGNNVILFPGCKLIGNIIIGDNVVVGANSVVTKDVPSNCIVAGSPARIISNNTNCYFSDQYFGYVK